VKTSALIKDFFDSLKQTVISTRMSLMKTHMFISTLLALGFLALSPIAQAVEPAAPATALPGGNTADGQLALGSVTSGLYNSAFGIYSLLSLTDGNFCTGVGAGTLLSNTGNSNTASGAGALLSNTSGGDNTANGAFALFNNTASGNTAIGSSALLNNTTGGTLANIQGIDVGPNVAVGWQALESNTVASANTAVGYQALHSLTTGPVGFEQLGLCTAVGFQALANATAGGFANSAFGYQALISNTTGTQNTATGGQALQSNTIGNNNTANGIGALSSNTAGNNNTAVGVSALSVLDSGDNNVALGKNAGSQLPSGNGNVYIGADVAPIVPNGEADHTYIRNINTTSVSGGVSDTVTVDLNTGLLGHLSSSRRYKEDIKPMDDASEALFALTPVMYRYKKDIDRTRSLDYGLIAEDVAKVDPNLAILDGKGQIESVRYSAVNAMLLNEFLKEHKKVEELECTVQNQEALIAQQQEGMETLTAQLKEQAAQIQKVSAQIETSRPVTQLVKTP
jgi:hypothetical protein